MVNYKDPLVTLITGITSADLLIWIFLIMKAVFQVLQELTEPKELYHCIIKSQSKGEFKIYLANKLIIVLAKDHVIEFFREIAYQK